MSEGDLTIRETFDQFIEEQQELARRTEERLSVLQEQINAKQSEVADKIRAEAVELRQAAANLAGQLEGQAEDLDIEADRLDGVGPVHPPPPPPPGPPPPPPPLVDKRARIIDEYAGTLRPPDDWDVPDAYAPKGAAIVQAVETAFRGASRGSSLSLPSRAEESLDAEIAKRLYDVGLKASPARALQLAPETLDNNDFLCIVLGCFEQESIFRNVMGCDAGAPLCHKQASEENVKKLVNQRGYATGNAPMNGVGVSQITWYTLVLEAMKLGGAWVVYNQALVGAKVLLEALNRTGWSVGDALEAYNTGARDNPTGQAYAAKVMPRIEAWRKRLVDAKPEPKPPKPPPSKRLAHGVVDGTNFAEGFKYLMNLIDRMPYEIWSSGPVPSGPMAYAENKPLPAWRSLVGKTSFCAMPPNIHRRAARKIIPTRGNPLYDGGIAAYWWTPAFGGLGPGFFSGVNVKFDFNLALKWARDTGSGVLLGRSYTGAALKDQGHDAILLPDGSVMESIFPGGLTITPTLRQSTANAGFTLMVHPRDWINHEKNNF